MPGWTGYVGTNQFGLSLDYRQHVRELLAHWCLDPAVEVWLIPHVLSDSMSRDDDRVAIATLAAEFPQARLAPSFASPSEAKGFISGMNFMTGARMHACIAAFSSGVPVVPFAYSRKFNGLFASLGYGWLADGKAMSNAEAFAAVMGGFERLAELGVGIRAGMAEAGARLERYEDYLTQVFGRCLEGKGPSQCEVGG
jgi:polysaccharide pyruvyl transferase WcaK-like protein